MNVSGVGEVTELDECWQLVYQGCGHTQDVAKMGLETGPLIEDYVRRNYAWCLTCSLKRRLGSAAD